MSDYTIEEIDLTNDVISLENVSLRELEDALYAMVEKSKRKSNEGDSTFAA